jgi:hypothetical protein
MGRAPRSGVCARAQSESVFFSACTFFFLHIDAALRNCGGTCRSIFKRCCVVVAPAEVALVLFCDKVLVGSFFSGFLAFLRCDDDLQLFPLFFAGFPFVISTSIAPTHTRGDNERVELPCNEDGRLVISTKRYICAVCCTCCNGR